MLETIIMVLSGLLVMVAGVVIIKCCGGDWTEPQNMFKEEIVLSILGVIIILGGIIILLEVAGVL